MMRFKVEHTELSNVIVISSDVYSDQRGSFTEAYRMNDFTNLGIKDVFVQDNTSVSSRGTIRGLHGQKSPMSQAKLVRCVNGAILDVAVCVDRSSKDFGKYVAVELSADNKKMLYIPSNMLHGFSVLSETATIYYKCSNYYSKEHEYGFNPADTFFNIDWQVKDIIISDKDKQLPYWSGVKEQLL